MRIKRFDEFTVNEWFFNRKPIDNAVIELEMIINDLPNEFDDLYKEIINQLNDYKKFSPENMAVKLISIASRVIEEVPYDEKLKSRLENFIYKTENDFNLVQFSDSDSDSDTIAIQPEIVHKPKPKIKNVKDYSNWMIDITPREKRIDDDETF